MLLIAGAAVLSAQTTPPTEPTQAISLPALVGEITAKNPERQFYQDEIAAAKVGQRYSATWSDPELSFDLGRKRVKDATGSLVGEGNAWSVSVTQTFEWPGRLALRKAIANRDVELAELGLARFENALTARARSLAYGLHASNAKAAAVREVAERFTALKETFLAREPAGITPLLETRVIEAAELSLQRRATEAELAVQEALIELNQLRGAAPDDALKVAAPAFTFNDVPDNAALVAAARENIRHGQRTLRTIRVNITFSLGLKALFLGLALAGHTSLWLAIVADTGATLLVVANSLRLLRVTPSST